MTEAVCDSGPLTHLWQIGLWSAFGTFEAIHLVVQVAWEVQEHVPLDHLENLAGCTVHRHDVPQQELESSRATLSPGVMLQNADLATLALARQLAPDLVLTDDLTLRRAVEAQGQVPMGSVGILLRAYKAGLLNAGSLDQAIEGLFVHSTLYLSPGFKGYVRRLIAEMIAV